MSDLCAMFPRLPAERAAEALAIHRRIFPDLPPAAWTVSGSIAIYWCSDQRLAFAARQRHYTVAFHGQRGREAIDCYRAMGGDCPCGEVTIAIAYGRDFDPEPIRQVIALVLGG